nr:hypothetical protein Iba_chr13cCG15250 [Ipomoea batatas]
MGLSSEHDEEIVERLIFDTPMVNVASQIPNVATFGAYEEYDDFSNFGASIAQHNFSTRDTSDSTSLPTTPHPVKSSENTKSEAEEILSQSSNSSDEEDINDHFSFNFKSFQETHETSFNDERRQGKRVDDSEIPYYHALVSFNTCYGQEDGDESKLSDDSTGSNKCAQGRNGFHGV